MKQETISYLSTIKGELDELASFICNNPEKPFYEYKCTTYIVNYLKSKGFSIADHYMNMNTSFLASFGSGHPKICIMCKYDAASEAGHLEGNHLLTEISVGAAAALSKVIAKGLKGTIMVSSCPGEQLKSSSVFLARQGAFEDIDACFIIKPYIYTAESGSSCALLPLKMCFTNNCCNGSKTYCYSPMEASLFTFNSVNSMIKSFHRGVIIDSVSLQGNYQNQASKIDAEMTLRAYKLKDAQEAKEKLADFIEAISKFMNVTINLEETKISYEELNSNKTLSRLFSHNLKECGLTKIKEIYDLEIPLGFGNISKTVPLIYPFIGISDNEDLSYNSLAFLKETGTDLAKERVYIAIEALTSTIIDLLEKDSLLRESKEEFSNSIQ